MLQLGSIKKWMQRERSPLIGIDISSNSIKLIEISREGNKLRLESYHIEPLPPHAVVHQDIKDIEAVGQTLGRAFKKLRARHKLAACAVGGSSVITKIIQMPSTLNDLEILTQIRVEADRYIPFPLEEISFDFQPLQLNDVNHNQLDILLVATRTEHIDHRIDALHIASLTPKVIDVEAYAVERAVKLLVKSEGVNASETVAVIDIGAKTMTLHVVHQGRHIYSRDQSFGGRLLLEEIQNRYSIDADSALYALNTGDLPDDFGPEILEPFKESLAEQIRRDLQLFFASQEISKIDHVFLAGGTAAISDVSDFVEHVIHIPTTVANPFVEMSLSARIDAQKLQLISPSLVVATGLALWGVLDDEN